MTITRVGATRKYSANWELAFGGKKRGGAGKRASCKRAASAKKKAVRKKAK